VRYASALVLVDHDTGLAPMLASSAMGAKAAWSTRGIGDPDRQRINRFSTACKLGPPQRTAALYGGSHELSPSALRPLAVHHLRHRWGRARPAGAVAVRDRAQRAKRTWRRNACPQVRKPGRTVLAERDPRGDRRAAGTSRGRGSKAARSC